MQDPITKSVTGCSDSVHFGLACCRWTVVSQINASPSTHTTKTAATAARTSPTGRLSQFRSRYNDPAISKWDIFYYVYGLLHHPGYRERYALDLKRNLPRIPFAPAHTHDAVGATYQVARTSESQSTATKSRSEASGRDLGRGWQSAFHAFSRAGRELADLHLNYESVDRYELKWESTRNTRQLPRRKDAAQRQSRFKRRQLQGLQHAQIQRHANPA